MVMLVLGLALFTGTHLLPSLAPGFRQGWYDRLGRNRYRGLFSLALFLALALIVFGWRSAQPVFVYLPPSWLRHPAMTLVVLGFLFMVASGRGSRLCRLVRHPQLSGVTLWGVGHLMMNGDSRSLLLFGTLTAWTLVEMIAINRRDGAWEKPAPPGWGGEATTVLITLVVVGVIVYIHPWIAGMPVY